MKSFSASYIAPLILAMAISCSSKSGRAESYYWPNYQRGNTGAPVAVKALQCLLVARGYKIKIDGRFGQETQRAVQKFQSSKGLKVSGVMTSDTWKRLVTKLKKGDEGYAVRALQMQLNLIGFSTKLTNRFDTQTEHSVEAFQRRQQVEVDRIVGLHTWERLVMEAALYYE